MNPKKASKKKLMQKITDTQQQVSRPLTPPFDVDLEFLDHVRQVGMTAAELRLNAQKYRAFAKTLDNETQRATWLKAASKYKKAAQYMERSF